MCVLSVIHMLLPAAIWSSQCHTGAGGFLCVGTHFYCTTVVTPTVHPGDSCRQTNTKTKVDQTKILN